MGFGLGGLGLALQTRTKPARGRWRLVAIDLDGTLLDEDHAIPAEVKDCLRRVLDSEVIITLASGRMYRSAARYAAEIGLGDESPVPLITFNGAVLRTFPDGRCLSVRPVAVEPARLVADLARRKGYELITFGKETMYCNTVTECISIYSSITSLPPTPLGGKLYDIRDPVMKMIIFELDPEKMAAIDREVHELVGGVLEIAYSYPFFLEIMSPSATKGHGLLTASSHLGISMADTIAVGDSFNDIPMLKAAGLGVAVANAPDEVKAAAEYVAAKPRGGGVVEAMEKFILGA